MHRAIDAIWNRGDLDAADELFAVDYVNHGGLIADLVRGPEAIKVSAALFRLAFPDFHVTVEELKIDDEMVVVRWTARSIPIEDLKDDSVTANHQRVTGITCSRLSGGKIIESWTEWDRHRCYAPSVQCPWGSCQTTAARQILLAVDIAFSGRYQTPVPA